MPVSLSAVVETQPAISGNGITQHAAAGALAQVWAVGISWKRYCMVAKAAAQMERSLPVGQRYHKSV
ncbi:hypothetical protein B5690_06220 [Shigella flexneri 2a]|nr:hypothetical protein B5690_06220 [Shigella flexneri 2a]